MKILVIGGTQFVGRHIVDTALREGHEVTLFHRGETNPGLFPQADEVFGDRLSDLDRLDGEWDVAIDTCGYFPRALRLSTDHLKSRVNRYIFVSTISVYRDLSKRDVDESAYLKTLEDPDLEEVNWSTYGPLKTECEGVVKGSFGKRALVIRPGILAGPWDTTDRFSYWVWRVSSGGEVLAPGDSSADIQLLDARDLANWTIRCIEADLMGTFNAAGEKITFKRMLEACRRATDSNAKFTWVSKEFMKKVEIDTPQYMPLWNPEGDDRKAGLYAVDSSRAVANELVRRPLSETARDTWKWIEQHRDHEWKVGLDLLQEQEYLAKWHQE